MLVSLASESGREDGRNEDWAGATSKVAIVLDGLSEGAETGCIHGTPWFVHQLGSRLLALAGELNRTLRDALAMAIAEVANLHADTCDLNNLGSPCTTVAILRETANEFEYLVLSDSMIVFDAAPAHLVIADRSVELVATNETSAAYAVSANDPEHSQRYQAVISAQQQIRNQPGGYWVAQTDPAAAQHAHTGAVQKSHVAAVLVLSDGAARAVVDFRELEWPDLLRAGVEGGAMSIISRTRQLEIQDPDGKKWPRYKASDDASAIVCRASDRRILVS